MPSSGESPEYVYGGTPSEAVTVTAPVPPLHAIAVDTTAVAVRGTIGGTMIVTVSVQSLTSVTVKVCSPTPTL